MICVADTGFLRCPHVVKFLRKDGRNMVAIPEAAQWESYGGGDALINITNQIRHVRAFPQQVLILKGARAVIDAQNANGKPISRDDLVDWPRTRGFPEFCRGIAAANKGDLAFIREIRDHGSAAREQGDRLRSGATLLVEGLRGTVASMAPDRLKRLRKGDNFTDEDVQWFWEGTQIVARSLFDTYPEVTRLPTHEALSSSWPFRYATASYALLCWWVRHGGFESIPPARLANDICDVAVVAAATYFDNLLSLDSKMLDVFEIQNALVVRLLGLN